MNPQLVIVSWVDVVTDPGWAFDDPLMNLAEGREICETTGWLVKDEPDYILVAGSRNRHGDYADRTRLPRSMVTGIDALRRR